MLSIHRSTAKSIFDADGFDSLVSEYADECRMHGLPDPAPKLDAYRALEASGCFCCLAAMAGGRLAGIACMLAPVIPHYGRHLATMESYFVRPAYRAGTGAGLALLREAESWAQELGCPALMVSAPADSRLQRILPRQGYRVTNVVYTRFF